jgi:hypothetical protein
VDQTASARQFGSPTAIYQQVFSPAMRRRQYRSILITILSLLSFPSFLFIGSLLSIPRQAVEIIVSTVLFIPLGLFTLLLVSILVRRMTISWYVFLYSEGFISARGNRIDAVRWDQVTAIRQAFFQDIFSLADGTKRIFDNTFLNLETARLLNPHERDLPRCTLFGRQETEMATFSIRFEAARNQEMELIHVMEREVVTRLSPLWGTMYQEGSPVIIGQLQISTKGINDGKTTLPWDEVDQITLRGEEDDPIPDTMPTADSHTLIDRLAWWQKEISPSDTLLITRKGEHDAFWSKTVLEIPNAFLLMELTNHILRQFTHNR